MTNEEAIKILEVHSWGVTDSKYAEAVDKAKKATEALEKQIPKKIIPADEEELAEQGWYMCPVCHTLEYYSYKSNYCDVCGQRLDWSEVEK